MEEAIRIEGLVKQYKDLTAVNGLNLVIYKGELFSLLGVSGALFTNVAAWLSSIWFDLDIVGGTFQAIGNALPFVHAVDLEKAIVVGNFSGIFPHIWWILGYSIVALVLAILLFLRQMKKQ